MGQPRTPKDWQEAPEAAPRAGESVALSIRLPKQLLDILKEFARREGIGYQVLMKRWLDERVRGEYQRLKAQRQPLEAMVSSITVQAETRVVPVKEQRRPKNCRRLVVKAQGLLVAAAAVGQDVGVGAAAHGAAGRPRSPIAPATAVPPPSLPQHRERDG